MAWARKKDTTHAEVVAAFKTYGWTIMDSSRAPKCADLVVSRAGRVVLVEAKSPKRALTDEQRKLFEAWQGETAIVRSWDDVARLTAGCGITSVSAER